MEQDLRLIHPGNLIRYSLTERTVAFPAMLSKSFTHEFAGSADRASTKDRNHQL